METTLIELAAGSWIAARSLKVRIECFDVELESNSEELEIADTKMQQVADSEVQLDCSKAIVGCSKACFDGSKTRRRIGLSWGEAAAWAIMDACTLEGIAGCCEKATIDEGDANCGARLRGDGAGTRPYANDFGF